MDIDEIEQVVTDILGVTVEDMHSRTRRREVVWARQIIIYYCLTVRKWNTGSHYQKDRTTVYYIAKKVPEMIEYDKEFAKLWNEALVGLGHQGASEKNELSELCNNVSYG